MKTNKALNIVLLNPPNAERIQRRYMCSYNAPSMLLPPHELIALGGVLRSIEKCKVFLIDAIAEELDLHDTINKIESLNADLVVSIHGFECFEDDMKVLDEIKASLPTIKVVLFGYYATLFPEKILQNTSIDFILLGEPDNIFGNFIKSLISKTDFSEVEGIAYRSNSGIIITDGDKRITHPELLPMPAYDLLKAEKYFEPLLSAPFGLIQSARGCPYSCNFCVRSFGKRLTYRTTDQIIEEIVFLKQNFGIKSLRFIDDTFTVHTRRVIEICQKMIEMRLDIEWTCLSRIDTLREEMIPWMKKAGCKRIYFGAESGSPKVLGFFNKEIDINASLTVLSKCKSQGIETVGFFLIGAPVEEEEDFYASVNYAIEADFDYIAVNEFIPYPGTVLFDQLKDDINFSLFPYKNEWNDTSINERNKIREKEFYRLFYYRKKFLYQSMKKAALQPLEYITNFLKLSKYLFIRNETTRSDYI